MARSPRLARRFFRLLEQLPEPLYVLDAEGQIAYANPACTAWVGMPAEDLIGRQCRYTSSMETDSGDAVAAALCPQPGSGGWVLVGPAEDRRSAKVVCLSANEANEGPRFVWVGTPRESQAFGEPSDHERRPAQLHEQLVALRQQRAGHYQLESLCGESTSARRIRAQVQAAAACRAAVLVCGPPGTGRRHVATAIHYLGDPGRCGSLVPLACSLLSAELVDSTIRALVAPGVRGQTALAGTLLLTEADQLPPEVQRPLACLLGDRSFPLRLIATASRPVLELAAGGGFSEELAALLSTIVVSLPPLEQRRGDLPLLAQYFLEQCNAEGAKQLAGFTPEALDQLDAHRWPGNMAELGRAVSEAYSIARGPWVELSDLPSWLRVSPIPAGHPPRKPEPIVLDELLRRIERELIDRALGKAKGNKARAARLLGLTRPRLYRRMEQLGMDGD